MRTYKYLPSINATSIGRFKIFYYINSSKQIIDVHINFKLIIFDVIFYIVIIIVHPSISTPSRALDYQRIYWICSSENPLRLLLLKKIYF